MTDREVERVRECGSDEGGGTEGEEERTVERTGGGRNGRKERRKEGYMKGWKE